MSNTTSVKLFYYLKKILLLLVILLAGRSIKAQDRLDTIMATMAEKYPQERVYIAYNKTSYLAGETIWFKAYAFSGYHLSNISTNLYIEILDSNHKAILSKKFPLIKGTAEGNMLLTDSLPESVYYVRAFTQWMLNFSEELQYIHPLVVHNPISKLKLKANDNWTAGAFVEGGNLLDGSRANIAVRIFASDHFPDKFHGYLADKATPNQKLVSFESLDKNIARFSFQPAAGKDYQVIVQDDHGVTKTTSLPNALSKGITLQMDQQGGQLTYTINFNNIPDDGTYRLVGTIDNDIVYKAKFQKTDSVFTHSFSTGQMPGGVLHLALFNEQYDVMTERLCFIYPEAGRDPEITGLSLTNKPRTANEFNLIVDSGNNYAMAVLDEKATDPFELENIVSAFWLTSDFNHTINNAAAYFSSMDPQKEKALDAILITEKWRQFNWEKIIHNNYPVIHHNKDNYLSYIATVNDKKKPFPLQKFDLILFLPDSTRQFLQAQTDSTGKFLLEGLGFEGAAKISYKPTSKKVNADNIEASFSDASAGATYTQPLPVSGYTLVPATGNEPANEEESRTLQNLKEEKNTVKTYGTLEDVTVKAKKVSATKKLDKALSSGRFYSTRETVYDFVNERQSGTSTNVLTWLAGKAISGPSTVYYVDEFRVSQNDVSLIPATDVAMIKIQSQFGNRNVLIYLSRGGETSPYGKPLTNTILQGYSKTDLFPLVDYGADTTAQKRISDTRDLLYWGNIMVSDSGSQQLPVKFYNNDRSTQFRAIIMGFSDEYTPVYYEKWLKKD